MATLTIADLDNGKRDLQTVAEVATSRAATATTRFGQQTTTLYEAIRRITATGDAQLAEQKAAAEEILRSLGYAVPVPYASGLNVGSVGFTVIGPDGNIYAPDASLVPFVTGAWDESQWYPIQNTLNDKKLVVFDTLLAAQTAAAVLPDGQVVDCEENYSRYTVASGALTRERPTTPLTVGANIVRSVQSKLGKELYSIVDCGAVGDGVLRRLSEKFSTLAIAQVAYPQATSLDQSIDWAATMKALYSGRSWIYGPAGHYMMTDTVVQPQGVTLDCDGVDLFMQSVPVEGSWHWSDEHGTHFYFVGTGAKTYTADILSNTQPVQTIGGIACEMLHFTNQDSVAGSPATPKPFSVAWLAVNNCGLRNCRIIPNHGNGLEGYLTRSGILSDEWDIGVWAKHPQESYFFNVQSVGHWRMSAWLQTESVTGDTQWNTSERCRYEKCVGVGVRGLSIRGHSVYWITGNTTDSITIKWVPSITVTRFPQVRTSQGLHTYTGYTFDSGAQTVTLTGISPPISGSIAGGPLRSGYSGNNLSNTVFEDCIFSPFDYAPTMPTTYFGLPAGFAAEFDGFPLRNPVFINTVFQTRWDIGNTIWGICNDFKYVACKHENGLLIANDFATAGPLHANNLRFIAEDSIWYDTQLTYFKPRSAIVDSYQNNQQGTSGEFFQRPLPGRKLGIQNQASQIVFETSATDGLATMWNGAHTARIELPDDGVGRIRMDVLRWLNAAGTETGRLTGSSATPTWELKGNILSTGYVRSSRDNLDDLGSAAARWRTVFAGTGAINTSDEREKTEWRDQTESERLAALEIKKGIRAFRFVDGSRTHFGVGAQSVGETLRKYGLEPEEYAFWCYDEWAEQPEIWDEWDDEFDKEGVLVRPAGKQILQEYRAAGNRYGIRYDELLAFIIAAL